MGVHKGLLRDNIKAGYPTAMCNLFIDSLRIYKFAISVLGNWESQNIGMICKGNECFLVKFSISGITVHPNVNCS